MKTGAQHSEYLYSFTYVHKQLLLDMIFTDNGFLPAPYSICSWLQKHNWRRWLCYRMFFPISNFFFSKHIDKYRTELLFMVSTCSFILFFVKTALQNYWIKLFPYECGKYYGSLFSCFQTFNKILLFTKQRTGSSEF